MGGTGEGVLDGLISSIRTLFRNLVIDIGIEGRGRWGMGDGGCETETVVLSDDCARGLIGKVDKAQGGRWERDLLCLYDIRNEKGFFFKTKGDMNYDLASILCDENSYIVISDFRFLLSI